MRSNSATFFFLTYIYENKSKWIESGDVVEVNLPIKTGFIVFKIQADQVGGITLSWNSRLGTGSFKIVDNVIHFERFKKEARQQLSLDALNDEEAVENFNREGALMQELTQLVGHNAEGLIPTRAAAPAELGLNPGAIYQKAMTQDVFELFINSRPNPARNYPGTFSELDRLEIVRQLTGGISDPSQSGNRSFRYQT